MRAVLAAFVFKKSFISKLKNIATVASVRMANLNRIRITMAIGITYEERLVP